MDTEYLGRRCKALAAIAGGVAINAATIKQVSKEPFVATVPLVCCIAAAAGDLSRRLLLQRVADLPEIVDFLTPTGLLLWALALWPGRTRRRGGGVVGVLRRRRVSDRCRHRGRAGRERVDRSQRAAVPTRPDAAEARLEVLQL